MARIIRERNEEPRLEIVIYLETRIVFIRDQLLEDRCLSITATFFQLDFVQIMETEAKQLNVKNT